MCGIVAILSRRSDRDPPTATELLALLDDGLAAWRERAEVVVGLEALASEVANADGLLRGGPGVRALLADPGLAAALRGRLESVDAAILEAEACVEQLTPAELERGNAALVAARDAAWAIRRDRLRTADA